MNHKCIIVFLYRKRGPCNDFWDLCLGTKSRCTTRVSLTCAFFTPPSCWFRQRCSVQKYIHQFQVQGTQNNYLNQNYFLGSFFRQKKRGYYYLLIWGNFLVKLKWAKKGQLNLSIWQIFWSIQKKIIFDDEEFFSWNWNGPKIARIF